LKLEYKSGKYTQKQLAKKYGIGQPHVSAIVLNKIWKPRDMWKKLKK
jgi:Helix-turn-helix